jgi:hypothetical protein
MFRRFLNIGKEFNDTVEKQVKINEAIKSIQWFDSLTADMGYMQCEGLRAMNEQFGRKPDKFGCGLYSVSGDCYGILAMRNNYSNGKIRRATLYSLDTGINCINIAVDEETAEDVAK